MATNLLDLPVEILIVIFENIKTLSDKKNFATAHPKLWDVIYHSRKDIRSEINFYNNKELVKHWEFILEWWGLNLNKIENVFRRIDSGNLIEMATKKCPNLEILVLEVEDEDIEQLEEHLPKLKKLKQIEIRYASSADQGDEVIHSLIRLLENIPSLRHLYFNFDCLQQKTREQLDKLMQLEILEVRRFQEEHVIDIAHLLGNLRVLRILETNTPTLEHFAEHCKQVERLMLYDYYNIGVLPYFPKLTNLQMSTYKKYLFLDFLHNLNHRYFNQLQVLDMEYLTMGKPEAEYILKLTALKTLICWTILPECLEDIVKLPLEQISTHNLAQLDYLRLVKECSSLREITCNYREINEEFLPELLDLLKAKRFHPDQPFQLNVRANDKGKKTLNSQISSLPNSNLLRVHYKKLQ